MDIREKTGLIVRRGNEYLVGRIIGSRELRWSISPWDAWYTREIGKAQLIAQYTGGEIMLFNPVAKQIRKMEVSQ